LSRQPRQQRGIDRRAAVIAGAHAILSTAGPSAISARAVAAAAEVPLSAVTYYFESLDEIIGLAAADLVADWLHHGRQVADGLDVTDRPDPARLLADALLPSGDDEAIRTRYEHLVAAGRVPAVAGALAGLRPQLLEVIDRIRSTLGLDTGLPASTVLSAVDGAAVGAISEGRAGLRAIVIDELGLLLAEQRRR